MDVFITNRGLMIDYNFLKLFFGDNIKEFINNYICTFKTKFYTKNVNLYELTKTSTGKIYIILPRNVLRSLIKLNYIKSIKLKLKEPKKIDELLININLNDNQNVIVNHIMDNIFNDENAKKGLCNIICDAPTGSGKTVIGLYIVKLLKVKTLIITPLHVVLDTWKTDSLKFAVGDTNEEKKKIYERMSFNDKKNINDISVMVVDSALKLTDSQLSEFGLVIYDEVHKYCTKEYMNIFKKCQFKYVLGLSATPNHRNDGFDKIAHMWVGDIMNCVNLSGYKKDLQKIKGSVNIVYYNNKYPYNKIIFNDDGSVSNVKTIKHLCNDKRRNKLIINKIIELIKFDKCIYVFSEFRKRAHYLNNLFNETYSEISQNKIDTVVLLGNYSDDEINLAKDSARIIFTTYALLEAGANIPKQTAIVLDCPRKSGFDQISGRITRNDDRFNNIERIIVDIVDNGLYLRKQLEYRIVAYTNKDFLLKYEYITDDDNVDEIASGNDDNKKISIINETNIDCLDI